MRDYFIKLNVLDDSTVTPVAEEPNFPATNVLDDLFFRRWKVATDTAEADFELVAASKVQDLIIRFATTRTPTDSFHNFGENDTVTITLWDTDPDGTELFSDTRELNVDDLGYCHWDLGEEYTVGYVRITIYAPDLVAAGDELLVENIFLGAQEGPRVNKQPGATETDDDKTSVDVGDFSGAHFGEPRAVVFTTSYSWDVVNDAEAAWWKRFGRTHGSTRTFCFIKRPSRSLLKEVLIARFTETGRPSFVEGENGTFQVQAEIVENR